MEDKIIKMIVKELTNNARWDRLLNLLQSDKDNCVDSKKYVNIKELRNLLYWDIVEHLQDKEWGQTTLERESKMLKVKG